MVEIPKEDGKLLIARYPQYVTRTVHKRHYYIVDHKKAWQAYRNVTNKERP